MLQDIPSVDPVFSPKSKKQKKEKEKEEQNGTKHKYKYSNKQTNKLEQVIETNMHLKRTWRYKENRIYTLTNR